MSNTNEQFATVSLKNTESPNNVTKAEFDSGNVALVAKYKVELNDQATFYISGGNGADYSKTASAAPAGVEKGEVGVKLDIVQDGQLIEKNASVYCIVRRNGIEQGQSPTFYFSVAAS